MLHRSGRKPRITAEQQAQLASKACEDPRQSDRPISQWSSDELADQMSRIDQGFDISGRWVRKILQKLVIRPHRHKYWLYSKDKIKDPMFDAKVNQVCEVYADAIKLYQQDQVHTICIDEMTGIQALQRIHPDQLVAAGRLARLEYEYRRHGTTGLFGNFHVATGRIWCPLLRQTRTEWDMLENINNIICHGGEDAQYRLVMDNLNTHCSETMVMMIAELIDYRGDLGVKGRRGHSGDDAKSSRVLERSESSHPSGLHAASLFLA